MAILLPHSGLVLKDDRKFSQRGHPFQAVHFAICVGSAPRLRYTWAKVRAQGTGRLGTRKSQVKVFGWAQSVQRFVLPVDPYHNESDKMTTSWHYPAPDIEISTVAGLKASDGPNEMGPHIPKMEICKCVEIKEDVLSEDFTSLTTYSETSQIGSHEGFLPQIKLISKRSLGLLEDNNKLFCIYLIYHFLIYFLLQCFLVRTYQKVHLQRTICNENLAAATQSSWTSERSKSMEWNTYLLACLSGLGQKWDVMERKPEQASSPSLINQNEWITVKRLLHFVSRYNKFRKDLHISQKKRGRRQASFQVYGLKPRKCVGLKISSLYFFM